MPEYQPTVPPQARAVVYYTTLAVAAASALISGLAGVWLPAIAPQILATTGVVTTVMGIIGGGLGVVYRPGRTTGATTSAQPDAKPDAAAPALVAA